MKITNLKESYNYWSEENDNKLRHLIQQGKSIKDLANHFQRTEGAITSRLKRLGLSTPSAKAFSSINQKTSFSKNMKTDKDIYNHPIHGRIRKHYATGLEVSEDGTYISKPYSDSHTGDTKYFSPDILTDSNGREYVSWNDKKAYIDEMVCTCFHGSRKNGQKVEHIDGDLTNSKASNLKWS